MSWITSKESVPQSDYKEYINKTQDEINEYVRWKAKFSGYPPAGYGFKNAKFIKEGNKYYCTWEHSDNCD